MIRTVRSVTCSNVTRSSDADGKCRQSSQSGPGVVLSQHQNKYTIVQVRVDPGFFFLKTVRQGTADQYLAQFRVVVVADDLTVSFLSLSSTRPSARPHGVSRFFDFQPGSKYCIVIPS